MTISGITTSLARQVNTYLVNKQILSPGLLGGDFGAICFMYFYSRIDHRYEELADKALDRLLATIASPAHQRTYCNGLAGMGYGLHLLENAGLLQGADEAMGGMDAPIAEAMYRDLYKGNLDFLHGATGMALYFIMRRDIAQITHYIQSLKNSALWGNDSYGHETAKWVMNADEPDKRYNISMSHGMTSIGITLCKAIAIPLPADVRADALRMIYGIINYIMDERIDAHRFGSFFPTFPHECQPDTYRSRLAWCYGDPGIAAGMITMGRTIHDDAIVKCAVEALQFDAVHRRSRSSSAITDAGLCHGAAGVAQVFKAVADATGSDICADAYRYWRDMVMQMVINSPAGPSYRTFRHPDKWSIEYSLLEGISGVGMFLMNENSFLNRILLLP